jgi:hypothetical protein
VRFQILTATSMNIAVFWNVATCILVDIYRRFRRSFCLRHQGEDHHHPDDGGSSSSETSVNVYQTIRCKIPEDSRLEKMTFVKRNHH